MAVACLACLGTAARGDESHRAVRSTGVRSNNMSKPPEVLMFEDREVACWTFAQLERLSKNNLKQRAYRMRHTMNRCGHEDRHEPPTLR